MEYKKIFKNRKIRQKILRCIAWLPDKTMLKIQYRIKFGRKLNLNNPKRFTEKLQWYKMYYKNPELIECVDKYDVRAFVEKKGLGNILVESYGVYSNSKKIDFNKLPDKFVIKDTLGSGGNSVLIIDKTKQLNFDKIRMVLDSWVMRNAHIKDGGREWPYYSGKQPRLLIEEYLEPDDKEIGLIDYKFFCFNGNVEFVYVMCDRKLGTSIKVGIYDRNYRKLNVRRVGDPELPTDIGKPQKFEEMITIAEKLAESFPHVRVDLYNNKGMIKFGELTFYNASGYMKYDPDTFDKYIGEKFKLPKKL
ncbi:ATP-grasp fold amidoligase family protein [Clostridium perfringens]|uniref:ATP-grasp fold amidoligase family protein n=1 Tax=Clostridium perfringens TaxID=1502 RepID=UPI0018E4171C|nr:ATP-grasp fold amidoligase family protein [Clostridium perfringens]MBI6051166.1 carbonic anhydrase [Clostridium perfringens]MDK0843665.1 ATP-grasp fold amidoligase family protein [Clostridium perfringens]HAT4217986.1 carbonic anhydrase [Clostridium perfringens]